MKEELDTDLLDFDTEALDPKMVSQAELDHYAPRSVEDLNERLPQYEFISLIAVGGMGAVYKARQPKLDRLIAVKLLPKMTNDAYGFADRFEREAQAMAKLSHPHIVPIFDFGETEGGQAYFVMEFVEGADLYQLICGGQLTLAHFFGWIPQVCSAIQYAHNHDIVHRDIKPANILIDKEGNVKMADFGLARLTGAEPIKAPEEDENEPSNVSEKDTDISMGTPGFAAPEQFDKNVKVDGRADIYALGVVMYQMLTGKMPKGAFQMPSECNPQIDIRIDEVVLRAIQQNPEDRFQTIDEIADRLNTIHATENDAPSEPEPEIDSMLTPSGRRLITGHVKITTGHAPVTPNRLSTASGKVVITTDRVAIVGKPAGVNTGQTATGKKTPVPQASTELRRAMDERDASIPKLAVFSVIAAILVVIYLVVYLGKKSEEEPNNDANSSVSNSEKGVSSNSPSDKKITQPKQPVPNPDTEAGKQLSKIVAESEEIDDEQKIDSRLKDLQDEFTNAQNSDAALEVKNFREQRKQWLAAEKKGSLTNE